MCYCVYCIYLCFCVICMFFFFFKQKTAYEMRISDWSSDVCSSDLPLQMDEKAVEVLRTSPEGLLAAVTERLRGLNDWTTEELEIGRASCRERVCQYV